MDLTNAARVPTEKDDKFAETMGAFCQQARKECDILTAMAQKMTELYTSLAEYFVFDAQKYSLEDFMGDIKTFKQQFKVKQTRIFEASLDLCHVLLNSLVFKPENFAFSLMKMVAF